MSTAHERSLELRAELAAGLERTSCPRSIHTLLGRFAGFATAPTPSSPTQWFVTDFADAEFASKEEFGELVQLMMDTYNDVATCLAEGRDVTPPPEDADAIRQWCAGYLEAVLIDEVWMDDLESRPMLAAFGGLAGEKNHEDEFAPEHLQAEWRTELSVFVRAFYEYWAPTRRAMAQGHAPDLGEAEPFRREQPKISRNAPCPCGSGKKYKRCCGNPAQL